MSEIAIAWKLFIRPDRPGKIPVNQTSLNLLAITIFTVTMTTLVSPLLDLSPVIPALITASLLGLVTIDYLSWQGRGLNLLLDWLTRKTGGQEYEQRILHHEAGHFLVAYLLGIPVTDYSLNAWEAFQKKQPGLGGVRFDTQSLEQQLQAVPVASRNFETALLLDRYFIVWMAGIAAETLVYGTPEGGTDDRQRLQSLWSQLKRPISDYTQKERWAILQAESMLEKHRTEYETLVTAMQQRTPAKQCYQILQETLQKV